MLVFKPDHKPKGSVFVFKNSEGLFFKSVNKTNDGLVFTRNIKHAWHTHSIFGANQMKDQFNIGGVDVELKAVPSFCGYCSG